MKDEETTRRLPPLPLPPPPLQKNSASASPPPPSFPLLAIKHAEGAAQTTTGHSPFLAFEVRDLQGPVEACLRAGGRLDGAIRHGVAQWQGFGGGGGGPGGADGQPVRERGEGVS